MTRVTIQIAAILHTHQRNNNMATKIPTAATRHTHQRNSMAMASSSLDMAINNNKDTVNSRPTATSTASLELLVVLPKATAAWVLPLLVVLAAPS
jgi:hypothetical protein